jgi:hypothetical protein
MPISWSDEATRLLSLEGEEVVWICSPAGHVDCGVNFEGNKAPTSRLKSKNIATGAAVPQSQLPHKFDLLSRIATPYCNNSHQEQTKYLSRSDVSPIDSQTPPCTRPVCTNSPVRRKPAANEVPHKAGVRIASSDPCNPPGIILKVSVCLGACPTRHFGDFGNANTCDFFLTKNGSDSVSVFGCCNLGAAPPPFRTFHFPRL